MEKWKWSPPALWKTRTISTAYTPGVAEPCKEIHQDVSKVYDYCRKGNLVAVVTDGTAVLGLGDIGPEAGMPVMEGKAVLFKAFGNVDAFPICLASKDVEEIVQAVKMIAPGFGGINLEDISAPRCFAIEKRLKEELDIPVFHDDQHGTAVVTMAAMLNALKLVGKELSQISVVVNGAGAAGIACTKLLMSMGLKDVVLCDRQGAIYQGREGLNSVKAEMAAITNPSCKKGSLADMMKGADVFMGVSAPNVVTKEMVRSMNRDAIVFAMANPTPEIFPQDALEAGAKVVGTGRSDFPNQINNVLAFPGIFRGALDARASEINDEMKIAAAQAIASLIKPEELSPEFIIPNPFNKEVAPAVAKAVMEAAAPHRCRAGVMMERITAVIFDMDGLMFDTEQLYERTWGQAVAEQGKVFTREIHSQIMGRSKADSAQVLLKVYGPDFPIQKVIDRQTPLFFEALETETIPAKKGLFSLLDALELRGLKKAVASSSQPKKIDFLLKQHGLEHRFDCVVSGHQVHASKPNPEIFCLPQASSENRLRIFWYWRIPTLESVQRTMADSGPS